MQKMQMSLASEYQLPGRLAVCPPPSQSTASVSPPCLSVGRTVSCATDSDIFYGLTAAWPQYLY